jgi:preprotein translocase subunit SecG
MTLVRRVAMKISGGVVRYASPGCKEWAEGLAREVEFIEGDWAALRWAAGSSRVLLDRRAAPMTSHADVAERARRFSESLSNGSSSPMFIVAFLNLIRLVVTASPQQRIACGVLVITSIYMGFVVLVQQRKRQALSDTVGDSTLYCKLELERQRDFLRSGIGRSVRLAAVLFFIGMVFTQRGGFRANPFFTAFGVLVCVLVTILILRQPRRVQREIDEVNAVLKETR